MITDEHFEQLSDYACLDETEVGDYICELMMLAEEYDEVYSLQFSELLDKEMMFWLHKYKTETEITSRIERQPAITVRELRWKLDD